MSIKGLQIDYNFLNLPNYVKFDKYINKRGFKTYVNTGYMYRADGVKISKSHNYIGWVNSVTQMMMNITTDYLDGFQYETAQSVTSLKFVPTSEGYYNFENNKYIYNYTDHLGNVRLSYFNNGSGAEVLEENNYYPFGLIHNGYNALIGSPSYQYKYNGKELQTESGMYDYGARMYMPDIGRWGVIDAYSEKYTDNGTYNYTVNNPINFTDPDGNKIMIYTGEDRKNPEEYKYEKNRNYSKIKDSFLADTYKALDALYVASNIEIDGRTVNVLETVMNDSRELSLVQACESCSTSFLSGRNVKDREADKDNYKNIGTLYFANTKGVLFDDINDYESDVLAKQLNEGKLGKTSKVNSPTSTLGHDIAHAYDYTTSTNNTKKTNEYQARGNDLSTKSGSPYFKNGQEKYATEISTKINMNLKENPRLNNLGTPVTTTGVLSNKIKK